MSAGRAHRAWQAGLLLLLALHAWALLARHGLGLDERHKAVFLFHLDFERNLPTLYSAALLAWCSALCLGAGREAARDRGGWWALGGVFAFLAVDEAVAIHERLIRPLSGLRDTSTFLTFGWIVPYAALAAVVAAALWRWLLRLPPATRRGLVGAGAVYLAGAVGLEALGGRYLEGDLARRDLGYDLLVTAEEGLEIAGLLACAAAVQEALRRLKLQRALENAGRVELDVDPERLRKLREEG